MGTIDVAEFSEDVEALAVRFASSELPGLLSKRLAVPAGALAWVRDADGGERLLTAGQEMTGSFQALLVKTHDQALSFQVNGLKTRAGRTASAGVELLLRLPQGELQLGALRTALLPEQAAVSLADLRRYLQPFVEGALRTFVASRSAEQLLLEDPRAAIDETLRAALQAPVFSAGLDLLEVRHPSFDCEEFEELRRRRLNQQAHEEELERSDRLQQLRARIERNEKLKQHEVAEFAKVLQYQGILKEITLKQELDRKRQDEQLRRFEALHHEVGNDDLKALVLLLEDDGLKAQLIEQLIERDMSEEQLRAKKSQDRELKLEARLEALAAELETLSGKRRDRIREGGTRTRRVILVHGKRAAAYDPHTNVRREAPKEVYDLGALDLGYVRSARTLRIRGDALVAVGAQRGIYLVPEGGAPSAARIFRFPEAPRGQGGVNAMAYFDGWLYGSHSELGVLRWDLDGVARCERLFESVTSRHDSTRGVTVGADGKLYFASGPDVYQKNLVRPAQTLVAYRGTHESVTAFVVTEHAVFAGTRGGRVLRWALGDPGSPRELGVRKANPIYMLRTAEVDGVEHLLVGAKEHGITSVALTDGRARDYRAKEQVRWVDGATDFVFGVTRSGYALHVWNADQLDRTAFTIHVPDRIQDLWVVKERMGDAV